jgi:hypothetical protein
MTTTAQRGMSKRTLAAMGEALAARREAERRQREERGRRAATGKRGPSPLVQVGTVNEFAAQHGDYDQAGLVGGRKIMLNRGGTAVDRWKREALLTETQLAAITHCQRLWRLIDAGPRLVANLDRTVFGCPGDGNAAEVEARDDLHRIKTSFPRQYFEVFEMVCRFDEPAGTAGSRLANDSRSASNAARLVVGMIADMIFERERLSY